MESIFRFEVSDRCKAKIMFKITPARPVIERDYYGRVGKVLRSRQLSVANHDSIHPV